MLLLVLASVLVLMWVLVRRMHVNGKGIGLWCFFIGRVVRC
jgi:hypothetical protein